MRFESPVGHARAIDGLWRAARAGRLAHALCLVGRAGIGKFLAAEWLSYGLLCARGIGEPCGACGPCKRLKVGSHPDVFVLDAESADEEIIQVGQIAPRPDEVRPNVVEFLALRAMEGGHRVVLVREADRMTTFAQNTLLKTLEEPGERVLIVLETARPELLLPTVHSRCLRLDLRAPSFAEARAVLIARGLSEVDAADFARWSDGAPGGALSLSARGGRAMRDLIGRRLAGTLETSSAADELADIEGEFPGRTAAMVARVRARTFLDLTLAVLADGVRASAGVDAAQLAHFDLVPHMSELSARALRSRLEQCLRARQDVDSNLAPEAIVERALRALGPRRAAGDPVSDPLRKLALKDGRYAPEAFQFLFESLDPAIQLAGRENAQGGDRHVSGQELLAGMRHYASELFGPLAAAVWRAWGVRESLDWGRIVFLLVDEGMLNRQENDSLDDFRHGFDFDQAFVTSYEPRLPPELFAGAPADDPGG